MASCLQSDIYLKTEIQEKSRRILFFKTHDKKIKTIDRIIDLDSNIILQRVTKSIESGDTWRFKIFNRLEIEGNEIVEYLITKNSDNGKVISYNKCGEKIREKNVKSNLILTKFMTN
ncbi:hypothetical protein [Aquimarina sp. AD10]|uniref:hypothetical protein n=1 Tax=Aquimarina sp. AD10 TaxID=1714849 RepID=UPI0011C49F73|nr:hypothetical protein [Aquimarina sp. AD10]